MDRAIIDAQLRQIVASAEATKAAAEALLREFAAQEIDPGPVVVPEPTPPRIPEPTPSVEPEPTPDPAPEPEPPSDGDAGAARLVAMKLALDGVPRDQARTRLAGDYDVPDLDSLLEDVYARVAR